MELEMKIDPNRCATTDKNQKVVNEILAIARRDQLSIGDLLDIFYIILDEVKRKNPVVL